MNISHLKILFVQRVLTTYRLDLIKELCNYYQKVGIITSKGDNSGTLKLTNTKEVLKSYSNLSIYILPSFKIKYKGEKRSTSLFIYPSSIKIINNYDIIIFEGTTNFLNNIYLIPISKFLQKKIIFWDAGYSQNKRTFKRKTIDLFNSPLIRLSDIQMAYSNLAKNYLEQFMGAKNVFVNLNTINTSYFEKIKKEILNNNDNYIFNRKEVKLLYVGVIEKRKKIKELIDILIDLNKKDNRYSLTIIGSGPYLSNLKNYTKNFTEFSFLGPIYSFEKLKEYYFTHDLFILPGDGGLAIIQSLLFGLPVVTVKGADGTEIDYITNKDFLLDRLDLFPALLNNLTFLDRKSIYQNNPDISSRKWIKKLNQKILELY